MSGRDIPQSVTHAQIAVSDPDISAWVAANAGSGKTHVLAQRVIRLLLNGVDPARILCITFTKAAAANMANRVFSRLADWTALDDAALDGELNKVGVREIDRELRARARQLFAQALETPGGLKVQTIHAFCTHLLHVFPFEAKVAARFDVLDEAAERQLLDQLVLSVLLDASAQPEGPLGRALETAMSAAADATIRDVLDEAIGERDALTTWIEATGGLDGAIADLNRAFGLKATESLDEVEAEMTAGPLFPQRQWLSAAQKLKLGSKTDNDQARRLEAAASATGAARLEAYLKVFFTDRMTPRQTVVTSKIERVDPALSNTLYAERERLAGLVERRRAIAARDRSAALLTLAAAVIERYRAEKERRGLLDYDDLIDKALELLSSGQAAWVHYKLDRGIDHVLIDEAQDTSPKQWKIIEKLTEEFFAGAGARDSVKRTIFAVGDEKQSIFSFQGAAPREFNEMRRHFESAHAKSELTFRYRTFGHSFRSGGNVLSAVDQVFRAETIFASVTTDAGGVPAHVALPDAAPGLVEIWDTFKPEKREPIEAWDAPFDVILPDSPQERLAHKIASTVAVWHRHGIRPGEVLILVRRRGALFEAIIRALKDSGIAVAGADRLVLTEHIAVMDLLALADALLLPDDDLALATVLKSPLFGFDEDMLFRLAWQRKATLRQALRNRAKADARYAEAADRLDRLAEAARRETPFAFYARLLNAERGRARMLARLGHEAADAIDEFLNAALDYERGQTASLQGFVAWLRSAKAEIKRDMEVTRDEVRVMTVHGAKGLEARAVILADTTTPPHGWHPPRLLKLSPARAVPGAPERLVWAVRKEEDVGPMVPAREAALQAAEDEYRRLLYVAMTRAAERLIICGTDGQKKRPERCWYDLVGAALKDDLVEEPADDGDGTVWRYRKLATEAARGDGGTEQRKPIVMPDWLAREAPREQPGLAVISPSRAFDDEHAPRPVADRLAGQPDRASGLLRGNLLHRLMQALPDMAAERRKEAGRKILARAEYADALSAAERETVLGQVLAVLNDDKFAALFAPGSRAEVPIVGRLGGRMVVGQVDRLAVTAEAVLIADYKTDRTPPQTLDAAIAGYPAFVTQLALYRAVLMRLYRDRPVRAALVWTEIPQLMEIPAAALEAALSTYAAA